MRKIVILTFAALSLFLSPSIADAQAKNPGRGPIAAAKITAHEWGVWKIAAGRVTHIAELAAETPAFAFRSPACTVPAPPAQPPVVIQPRPLPAPPQIPIPIAPMPQVNPVQPPPVKVSRKPVLFLSTDQPVNLTVTVGFRGGEPWLYFPAASISQDTASKTLTFEGRLVPNAKTQLPAAAPGHWWNDLRGVGADLFLSDQGTAERFLFYDGPVQFERAFLIQRRPGGALVQPTTTERSLWFVDGDRFTESEVEQQRSKQVGQGDMAALRTRLDQELQTRGLTTAESRSLLDTWRDELFSSPSQRAIYFVPRHHYDLMLPLQMDPQPAELTRVGLVIESL